MTGRIRTLKPEWMDDERLAALDDSSRVLSAGLILLADDHGNGRAHPMFIGSHVWPYGESHETLMKVERGLSELSRSTPENRGFQSQNQRTARSTQRIS